MVLPRSLNEQQQLLSYASEWKGCVALCRRPVVRPIVFQIPRWLPCVLLREVTTTGFPVCVRVALVRSFVAAFTSLPPSQHAGYTCACLMQLRGGRHCSTQLTHIYCFTLSTLCFYKSACCGGGVRGSVQTTDWGHLQRASAGSQ